MSRVWIYQANRFLTVDEVSLLTDKLNVFVSDWAAHGSALAGKAEIRSNLFLLLEVDEEVAGVTGCSIDKSVHTVKALGNLVQADFFDRMCIAYEDETGELQIANRSEFEYLIKEGTINQDTIVYNNLVQNSEELAMKWRVPFSESWHSKVF